MNKIEKMKKMESFVKKWDKAFRVVDINKDNDVKEIHYKFMKEYEQLKSEIGDIDEQN